MPLAETDQLDITIPVLGLTLAFAIACIGCWYLYRNRRVDFEWEVPDDAVDSDYQFCEYENRFAYSMSSIINGKDDV